MPDSPQKLTHRVLSSAETRKTLTGFVRRRVPASEVDDVVQTILVEALASDKAPDEEGELRRWLMGVARHKIADLHRKRGRERPAELPEIEIPPAPIEEREFARWAEKQGGGSEDAMRTLEWMAREGEGDKLEHIAAEEEIPATRVRQRVSRMRRFMKERWLAEIAAVAAIVLLALMVYRWLKPAPADIAKDPVPTPAPDKLPPPVAPKVAEAEDLRKLGLEKCAANEPERCLELLDRAARLDPAGDTRPEIETARDKAERAIEALDKEEQRKEPAPPDSDSKSVPPTPTSTSAPKPPPTAKAPPANDQKSTPVKPQPSKKEIFEPKSEPPQQAPTPEPVPQGRSAPGKASKSSMK